jgi:putative copper resistance protein D
MALFGASTLVWVLAPRGLFDQLARPLRRWMLVFCAGLLVSTIGWLLLEAGMMGDGWADVLAPSVIATVLFQTEFGWAWLVHGLLVLGLLGLVLAGRMSLVPAASGLMLASLGLVGHAATQSGPPGWAHRANLALHLLAGGFWLGGLLPLLPLLRWLDDPARRSGAGAALRRFSVLGHFAVGLVVATGVVNTLLIRGLAPLDVRDPYGALLAIKVALVVVMIAVAVHNRYGLVPRLRRRDGSLERLRRNSVIELVLGGAVLALVSVFGLLDPM